MRQFIIRKRRTIIDFKAQWLNDFLGLMEENLDTEVPENVLANCSGNCTVYWAEQAKEIRAKYPNEIDTIILLNEFCKILPGGEPNVSIEDSKTFWSFSEGDCPCPIGNVVKNRNVCLCSIGHLKGVLEALLGKN